MRQRWWRSVALRSRACVVKEATAPDGHRCRPNGEIAMAVQLPKSTRTTSKEVDTRLDAVVAEQEEIFCQRQPKSWQLSDERSRARRRGDLELADNASPVGLDKPRRRARRSTTSTARVRRHARWLRCGPGRPRPSGDRRGGEPPGRLGTHFAQPTEDAIIVAEELAVAAACRCGALSTRAPRRRWTLCTSCGRSQVGT